MSESNLRSRVASAEAPRGCLMARAGRPVNDSGRLDGALGSGANPPPGGNLPCLARAWASAPAQVRCCSVGRGAMISVAGSGPG